MNCSSLLVSVTTSMKVLSENWVCNPNLLSAPFFVSISTTLSIEIFGNNKYSRAIGSTLALNSIAYLIPCHLVCYKNNKTKNYKWGADLKRKLIDHDLNQKYIW